MLHHTVGGRMWTLKSGQREVLLRLAAHGFESLLTCPADTRAHSCTYSHSSMLWALSGMYKNK